MFFKCFRTALEHVSACLRMNCDTVNNQSNLFFIIDHVGRISLYGGWNADALLVRVHVWNGWPLRVVCGGSPWPMALVQAPGEPRRARCHWGVGQAPQSGPTRSPLQRLEGSPQHQLPTRRLAVVFNGTRPDNTHFQSTVSSVHFNSLVQDSWTARLEKRTQKFGVPPVVV